jgi:hypothetical protein
MRERRHTPLPIRHDSTDRNRIEARRTRRKQRHSAVSAEPICPMTRLAILLINSLRWRHHRSAAATAAAGVFSWAHKVKNSWIIVCDNINRAGTRFARRAAKECTAVACGSVHGVFIADRSE